MPPAFSRSVDDREDWKGSKFGAALSPLESAAPISTPVPHSPEVGVAIFYNDLQSLGETQKQLVLRIFVNCCCESTRCMHANKPNVHAAAGNVRFRKKLHFRRDGLSANDPKRSFSEFYRLR